MFRPDLYAFVLTLITLYSFPSTITVTGSDSDDMNEIDPVSAMPEATEYKPTPQLVTRHAGKMAINTFFIAS